MDAEEILKGLNSDQRAAVLHDHEQGAQLLILAGAGSGKTSVLTKRIQYRILCGVEPEKILALTFTAKAAAEMRERVQKLFPNAGVRLCTFHSLALYMLKCKMPCGKKGGAGGECPAYELLGFKKMPVPTESSEREFSQALSKLKLKVNVSRENLFSDCYGAAVSAKLQPLREAVLESGQVVFEDLIYSAIQLLETNEAARDYFRDQWKEILVDEYQDINPSQYRLVKGLLGDRKQLFVVGDDDQAIYGFRGADIGNIERFCEDFKESTQIRLEWNYRSVPNVLYLANEIFKNKPIHLRKMLRAGNLNGSGGNPLYKENRKPEIWVSDNPVEEIQKIVVSIKELREDYDLAWKNFAILVRYNRQRLYYEQALRDYNIPIAGDVVTDAGEMENGAATSEVTVEDGVHIETVHASKGLQYAVVYYAGLCEKLTPGECTGDRKARKRQLDEERRLYYVGVTRAEACLFLLYCKRRFWKGKLRRFRRSRFLPHERNRSTEWNMPVILFKIYVVVAVLGYMLMYIIALPYLKLRYGKNFDAWLDHKIQDFSRYCMKVIRIDLTIEDQAQLGKVDWSRPVFVVGNHNSFVDIPIVFLAIQKTVGFVAKKSLGRIPFLNFWMHKIGCVLVNREKGGAAKAVRQAVSERGNSARIFIFPEGTRSKTGALGTFKSGVFRFACENDAIMLPLVIKGSGPVWERRKDTKRCKVNVKVLAPIDVLECRKENEKFDPKIHMLPMVHKMMEDAL
ncbi:UvrD-helicase domain-containing protein [Fibrobacter sp. UWB10]|uniref:UvrD-helicase domain-containing protein n=1 Tax=Fibrobacter sp. UWB10 TaxID=1896201 RepID=UPI002402F5C5|nr:UvrD-helicase domain-containing protein [Fibrobacter sp. UWB10]SMP55130.1 1-acyl-sn-glycerol-3-phosphate acyltransferases [Fibrobacter sp. UWB10]